MSTRRRPRKTTIKMPPPAPPAPLAPPTPEQIQVRDRIKELEAIGVKNHHSLVAKNPNTSAARGLWFAAHYLPDDLKAELEALRKKAA